METHHKCNVIFLIKEKQMYYMRSNTYRLKYSNALYCLHAMYELNCIVTCSNKSIPTYVCYIHDK